MGIHILDADLLDEPLLTSRCRDDFGGSEGNALGLGILELALEAQPHVYNSAWSRIGLKPKRVTAPPAPRTVSASMTVASSSRFVGGFSGSTPASAMMVLLYHSARVSVSKDKRIDIALVHRFLPGKIIVLVSGDASSFSQIRDVGEEALVGKLRNGEAISVVDGGRGAAGDSCEQFLVSLAALRLRNEDKF